MMHKAEKKYKVGSVTDEEQAKQRQLKAILNKLTPYNFEKLFEQVKAVKIDNAMTLAGVISQIFDKALMEPTFCEMYANLCCHLAVELPHFKNEENEKITFKRLLLNKCQEEFERGEREQEKGNKADEEGDIKQSAEEREEKRVQARRRMLGNIRLIGELYKKRMLTERIMHLCIQKLRGQYQKPDEEDVEALCKLMSTIGEMIDHPKAKEHMDAYFDQMKKLSTNKNLSSRVRFMLKDALDLRKNKWQQRRKVEGPKKIEEVHRDAAEERQAQSNSNMESSGEETISSIQSMMVEDEVISGRRPLCYCGIPSKLQMSDNPKSFGRQFLNCPYYKVKKQCGFFEWIDHEMEQPDCCKRTLELAQRRNERITAERARIEHAKFYSMKKKYKSALIASWVLFIALLVSLNFFKVNDNVNLLMLH